MIDDAARIEVERAARESYGRLLAYLAARSNDIAAAEDALSSAFAAALESWPAAGVPDKPEAWLLTVARRRMSDEWRHQEVVANAVRDLLVLADQALEQTHEGAVPDERLKLLFICAHPAIEAQARTPLMLQTVLGLDVARMASAFLVAPATLSQRLVRAKARIREARIGFDYPRAADLPDRLQDVMDGVYAAYGTGWDDVDGADEKLRGLTREAVELGRTLVTLLPHAAEPRGLLSLMLFCEARAGTRRDSEGRYVSLEQQPIDRWDRGMVREAERHLLDAAALESIGPYQLEAAIQSAHTQRRLGAPVLPAHILTLYDGLVKMRPRIGALVGRACAVAAARGADAGLVALDELQVEDAIASDYQPYWAARAHLLALTGKVTEARAAYQRAIGLSEAPAVRAHLTARSQALGTCAGSESMT